mmetsp:Transcript_32501/g.85218  ORF Transcript_32501/g.85218 Transcript_32501/m.85218 type:complete len:310 (+) Transcript_32501:55-984(+)
MGNACGRRNHALNGSEDREFPINKGDIIICSYPKCGTTWVQYIVLTLLYKGDASQILNLDVQSPFIEETFLGLDKGGGKDDDHKGKGKDDGGKGKLDFFGKGKGKDGKDKGKGKVKGKDGKGPPGGFAAVDPYAAYYPQAQAYQAAQMAQMAQMQYLQYAQMAQYQAAYAAQMAQMGGSGLWSPAARAAQMPSAAPQMTPEPLADGGKDKSKGKKGKGKGKAKSERPDQPKSNVAPPSPDKDFVGTLKSISEKNGYGFIECKEAYDSYGRDTWVDHKAIPSAAKVGDTLKFGVTLSEKGHPRAQKVSVA